VGLPVTINEAAQSGLNPGFFGLTGLPCGLTIDPTWAAGNAIGPTNTLIALVVIMIPGPRGKSGNPVTDGGPAIVAAGNGIT